MTINPPASILLAMYIVVAEKKGISKKDIGGTIQNDMLKEFIAQKTFMLPPKPSLRIIVDTIEYCTKEVPRWNTVSISGYHIREAGATALQELAFTLADGIAYVEATLERDLMWTTLLHDSPSSSTLTLISSKRSPSSGLPGEYGLRSCVSVSTPRTHAPGCFGFIPRPQGAP